MVEGGVKDCRKHGMRVRRHVRVKSYSTLTFPPCPFILLSAMPPLRPSPPSLSSPLSHSLPLSLLPSLHHPPASFLSTFSYIPFPYLSPFLPLFPIFPPLHYHISFFLSLPIFLHPIPISPSFLPPPPSLLLLPSRLLKTNEQITKFLLTTDICR